MCYNNIIESESREARETDMADAFDRYVDRDTSPDTLATWSQDDIENDIESMAREDALGHNPDADEAEITAYREQVAAEILAEAKRRVADDEDIVGNALACPYCHENRVDWLVWQDDHKSVECQGCHVVYEPIDD